LKLFFFDEIFDEICFWDDEMEVVGESFVVV